MIRSSSALRRLAASAAARPQGASSSALAVSHHGSGSVGAASRYLCSTSTSCVSSVHATVMSQPPTAGAGGSSSSAAATAAAAAAATAAAAVLLAVGSADGCAFAEGETLEEQREADWDKFMYKSIVPGEDDDDDDDDEDDEDEDEEEEEESDGGPADEAEDGGIDADNEQQNATLDQDEEGVGQEGQTTESPSKDESSGPADDAEDGAGEEGDPYDNLPEEDGPTGCTICLINRQGPCRPFWRKFERCMKDHGDATVGGGDGDGDSDSDGKESSDSEEKGSEDGGNGSSSSLAEMCDTYMLPWLNCIQSYRNTYTLITNNFYQSEYVDALEKAVPEADRATLGEEAWSVENNLDLSLWNEYVAEEKEKLKKDAESMSDEEVEEAINLAKAYLQEKEGKDVADADTASSEEKRKVEDKPSEESGASDLPSDPQLIPATTKIVLRDPVSGNPIDMAYVRDQDGRVLGFEQFTNEKKMMRGEPVEGKDDGDEPKEAPLVANCGFHLQPGVTTSFKVYALYREDVPCPEEMVGGEDKSEEKEKETPKADEKLYYTQSIPLVEGLDQ